MSRNQFCAKTFARLMKKLSSSGEPELPETEEATEVLVQSFLLWDATITKAAAAYKRLRSSIVDFNDLRVSMPEEIVGVLGERYPQALERSRRMRATLRHLYSREHDVTLDRLQGMGKREVRNYVRSLDGISPYVADRVGLLCFDTHCIPVDERLRKALTREGVCDDSADVAELASWLSRQVKASEARAAHGKLQLWADSAGSARPRTKTTRKKAARR